MTITKELKRFQKFMLNEMSGNHFDYFIQKVQKEDDIRSFVVQLLNNSKYKFKYEYEVYPGYEHFGRGDIIIWLKENICMVLEIKFFNKKNLQKAKMEYSRSRAKKLVKQTKYYSACCKINRPSNHVIGYCLFNYERGDRVGVEFLEVVNDISLSCACEMLQETKCGREFLTKHNIKTKKLKNKRRKLKPIKEMQNESENDTEPEEHVSDPCLNSPSSESVTTKQWNDTDESENNICENLVIIIVDCIFVFSMSYLALSIIYLYL